MKNKYRVPPLAVTEGYVLFGQDKVNTSWVSHIYSLNKIWWNFILQRDKISAQRELNMPSVQSDKKSFFTLSLFLYVSDGNRKLRFGNVFEPDIKDDFFFFLDMKKYFPKMFYVRGEVAASILHLLPNSVARKHTCFTSDAHAAMTPSTAL